MQGEYANESTPEEVGDNGPAPENANEVTEGGSSAEEEIGALRREMALLQDARLRQAAEFQNYRRRTEQEMQSRVELGQRLVIERMLDVLDDLERSLEAVQKEEERSGSSNPLRDGIELVYRKFQEALASFDVQPLDAAGKPFNEHEHDAMLEQPAPEGTAPGIVLAEFQKGYRMRDQVIRHSRVVVAS